MGKIHFTKKTVAVVENEYGDYPMNTFHAVGDVNGDGLPDIVVSGRQGRMVWLENRGPDHQHTNRITNALPWVEHLIDGDVSDIECGGRLVDLTGSGYPDVIVGSGGGNDEIWWWENPGRFFASRFFASLRMTGRTGGRWVRRVILKTGHTQFHDTTVGDALNDGGQALVFTNQHGPGGTTVYCIPLPEDPTVTPWPGVRVVAQGLSEELVGPDGVALKMQPEEGIAIGDVDGDGQNEIVCGTHWFKHHGGEWVGHKFARGYVTTKIAIGDVDGDGRNEIVLAEGDPCIYGKTQGGKVSWFKPGPLGTGAASGGGGRAQDGGCEQWASLAASLTALWEEHVLEDHLLDAHTLALGDLTGNGALDIAVGEIGVASRARGYEGRAPRILVFENDGRAGFTRHVIDEGTGIHDGVLADMRNQGVLDLVGKPLHGDARWEVHVYYNGVGGMVE